MGSSCGSGQGAQQVEKAESQKIKVYVKGVEGLPAVDWFPGTDRFLYFGVGADVGGDELFKSQQKKNVLDPVWNEECDLPANMPLKFTVFQSDVDGNTDVLACATLDLASTGTDQFNGELPLEMDGKLISGILTLKARSVGDYPAEPSSEFTVTIENPKKKALGLEVDAMDPSRLFVVRVKKGTVMDRFNETQLENKVDAGCFITSVTAADAGSITDMEKILKKNLKQVDLVCRRAQRFRVSLILTKGEGIGISVPTRATGNSLLITEVKANGAVEVWNTGNPDQIIELGDRIVAVNGKAGKAADLLKQIKAKGGKSASLVLTLVRMSSEVAS